jgi:uncharacterized protein (AIM24 family)
MVSLDHVGDVSPALLVQLAPRERVLVPIDRVRYRDPSVGVDRVKYSYPNPTSAVGLPSWSYFEALDGPGTATVSTGTVGEIKLGRLEPGQPLYVHDAALICHEASIQYRKVLLASYQLPGNNNTFYVTSAEIMGPGQYAIQCHGNVLSFTLKPGEVLRAHPDALVSFDHTVQYRVQVFGGYPSFPPQHFFPLLDLAGPGRVMIHSGRYQLVEPAGGGP